MSDFDINAIDLIHEALGNKKIEVPFVKDLETNEYVFYKIGSMSHAMHSKVKQTEKNIKKKLNENKIDKEDADEMRFNLAVQVIVDTIRLYNKSVFKQDEVYETVNNTNTLLLLYYYHLIINAHTAITDVLGLTEALNDKKKEMEELIAKAKSQQQQD